MCAPTVHMGNVFMSACDYVHQGISVHVCSQTWRPEADTGSLPTLFFQIGFLSEPGTHLARQASQKIPDLSVSWDSELRV